MVRMMAFKKGSMGVYNEPVDDRLKVSEKLPVFLELKAVDMFPINAYGSK